MLGIVFVCFERVLDPNPCRLGAETIKYTPRVPTRHSEGLYSLKHSYFGLFVFENHQKR